MEKAFVLLLLQENLPIHIEQLDVIDNKSVTNAIKAIVSKEDSIDVCW